MDSMTPAAPQLSDEHRQQLEAWSRDGWDIAPALRSALAVIDAQAQPETRRKAHLRGYDQGYKDGFADAQSAAPPAQQQGAHALIAEIDQMLEDWYDGKHVFNHDLLQRIREAIANPPKYVAWIAAKPGRAVLHFSALDGWTVEPVLYAPSSAALASAQSTEPPARKGQG